MVQTNLAIQPSTLQLYTSTALQTGSVEAWSCGATVKLERPIPNHAQGSCSSSWPVLGRGMGQPGLSHTPHPAPGPPSGTDAGKAGFPDTQPERWAQQPLFLGERSPAEG